MRKFTPALVIVLSMLIVLVGLFALPRTQFAPGGAAAGGGARVVIISVQDAGIQHEFKRGFEAWHQAKFGAPCEVVWTDLGGTSAALRYVKSQFATSPDGIGADLFWGGGVEPYLQLAGQGLLAPVKLPPEILGAIPAEIGGMPVYDPKLQWFGTVLSGWGILWNRPRLAALGLPEPKTWTDLAAPGFFGQVAAADPRASGTAQMMIEFILEAYGWDKGFEVLGRIAGNVKNFSRGASDIPKLVGMGEAVAGLAIDFYALAQVKLDGADKIGFALPKGLTPLTADAIGMFKGAPDAQEARRFIEFVLSLEGQRLWVLPIGHPGGPDEYELQRIPVLPEAYRKYADVTHVILDAANVRVDFKHDPIRAAARRDALKDLYGAVFVDLQPELSAAWKAVIRRGLKPDEIRELFAPLVTEPQLEELARSQWRNPSERNRILSEWTNQARERYRALSR